MGGYQYFEHDFIDRTLHLIGQYEDILHQYPFAEQYNYTLLINCLFGIIVMPKERAESRLPADRITADLKKEMGLVESTFAANVKTLKDLAIKMRHSISHASFEVESHSDQHLIDFIVFSDAPDYGGLEFARFKADELLPFVRYYGGWVMSNIRR